MQLQLDSQSISRFLEAEITELFIGFTQKWCEGTKVEVLAEFDRQGLLSFPQSYGIVLFAKATEAPVFDGARLTQVGTKWIFTSPKVQGRCGCGSSFRFEKKAIEKSKIKNLRILLQKWSGVSEIREKIQKPICED